MFVSFYNNSKKTILLYFCKNKDLQRYTNLHEFSKIAQIQ